MNVLQLYSEILNFKAEKGRFQVNYFNVSDYIVASLKEGDLIVQSDISY